MFFFVNENKGRKRQSRAGRGGGGITFEEAAVTSPYHEKKFSFPERKSTHQRPNRKKKKRTRYDLRHVVACKTSQDSQTINYSSFYFSFFAPLTMSNAHRLSVERRRSHISFIFFLCVCVAINKKKKKAEAR